MIVPLPSSTSMHVPDCSWDTGNGVLPMNEIRISFFGRVSVPGA